VIEFCFKLGRWENRELVLYGAIRVWDNREDLCNGRVKFDPVQVGRERVFFVALYNTKYFDLKLF